MSSVDFNMLKILVGGGASAIGLFEIFLALRSPRELTKEWSKGDFFHSRVRHSDYNPRQFLAEGMVGLLFGVPLLLLGVL